MNSQSARSLHIIPIVHSTHDLGMLKDSILMDKERSRNRCQTSVVQSTRTTDSRPDEANSFSTHNTKSQASACADNHNGRLSADWFWEELRAAIQAWDWEFRQLHIYQDALPVGADDAGTLETKIVSELAAKSNPNYVILSWLVSQGAKLIGTEDPILLIEEYRLVRQSLERQSDEIQPSNQNTVQLLKRRDAFIANRIDQTLPPSGVGLIFLGMLHRIEPLLAADIRVYYPFGRPSSDSIAVVNNY